MDSLDSSQQASAPSLRSLYPQGLEDKRVWFISNLSGSSHSDHHDFFPNCIVEALDES